MGIIYQFITRGAPPCTTGSSPVHPLFDEVTLCRLRPEMIPRAGGRLEVSTVMGVPQERMMVFAWENP